LYFDIQTLRRKITKLIGNYVVCTRGLGIFFSLFLKSSVVLNEIEFQKKKKAAAFIIFHQLLTRKKQKKTLANTLVDNKVVPQ
jgi:hypothetical protein